MTPDDLDITLRDVSLETLKGPELEDVINMLAGRIAQMLDKEPELLFSTLYRLDVLEHKINTVLHSSSEAPAHGLARLIVERQLEKIKTRGQWHKGWEEI